MRKAASTIVLVAVLISGACAQGMQRSANSNSSEQRTTIRVENNNWLDMVVYAVMSGSRLRLGSVGTGSVADFKLPSGYGDGSGFRLIMDPIGAPAGYSTEFITVGPGGRIQLRVENNLALSSVMIR
jgi:hypothetical protein